jgi:hypothetical protein
MKHLKFLFVVLFIFFLSTCNVGVNKDLLTGLTYSYKGLSIEDAYLTVDNDELKTNEIEYGKKVNIVLTGVKGYELGNGKVKIGCKIDVSNTEGKSVLSADDAFAASYEGGLAPEDAEVLSTALTVGKPLEIGKEYTWKSLFWDKNGKGTIATEIKIKIIPRIE